MKPWMFDMEAADGTRLHNAGAQYSEAWWKVSQHLCGGEVGGWGEHARHMSLHP